MSSVVEVVETYICFFHQKDHAQYALCNSSVRLREIIDFFLLFFFPVLSARVWVLWAFALFVSTNTLVCQHLNLSVLNKANKNLCTHLSHEQLGVYCHFRYITFWHKINVNFRFLPLILLLCQLVSAKIILSRSIHFLARKCMVVDLHQFWKKKKRRLPLLLNSCYL